MEHIILYAIVPIIVVMLAGYISGKKGIFSGANAKAFNKVVLDYALPAALFVSIVDADRKMLVDDIKLSPYLPCGDKCSASCLYTGSISMVSASRGSHSRCSHHGCL